ncbi:hypothetical protein IAT38_008140 [Cryptococcus sp. DSM 104549]
MIPAITLLALLPSLLALPMAPSHRTPRSSSSSSTTKVAQFDHLTSSWPAVPFQKLGGFSPWAPRTGEYGIDGTATPASCTVNQVQLFMRHAEREASGGTHKSIVALSQKLANATYSFDTDDENLKYLQSWSWTDPAEYLTPLGSASAYAAGVDFQGKYRDLLPENAYFNWTGVDNIPVRSTDQQRVNATAQAFTAGFLGIDYAARSDWSVTPDSLTTFNSTLASNNCPAVNTISSQANGIFNGYFQPLVVERLSPLMEGFNLTVSDVAALMNACPFDSFKLQKPSPICSLFTEEEWKGYNYAYDLTQFDNAGYGGPIGSAWGVGWVVEMIGRLNHTYPAQVGSINSTLATSAETFPLDYPIYLDFTHDTALESAITAMQLLKADYNGNVTLDTIDENRAWQSAKMAPMGGRLVVEKLSCASGGSTNGTFVRMLLNDAVLPLYTLEECNHSWGADQGLCELSKFISSQAYALEGADFANCANNYTGVAL